ncbi:sensor histidine kinase [Tepidiphilus olei]|uniref:sensor histidine kinase n=1 Tax=Tepidiphilus olei TaxID=2502184 RepID=UPI00163DCF9C|nr:HAMP domain-containing sensor histidine kinase [Tepidiphilus olei]
MKKRPHSLRVRLIAAFAFLGVVLGPLVSGIMLWVSYQLEERAVMEVVQDRLTSLMAAPENFALRPHPRHPEVLVSYALELETLPDAIFFLPDGVHEFELGRKAWIVGFASLADGRRFAVLHDISSIEQREWVSVFIMLAGTVLAGYAALWFGFYFSRRLLAPLNRLAERLSVVHDFSPEMRLADEDMDEEVLVLARALEDYRQRMFEALVRERDFSADASHELRTPLTVIRHAAELLASDPSLSERSRRALARIDHASVRMAETIETLLLLAREPEATREEFDVSEIVRNCLAQVEFTPRDGGPVLHFSVEASPTLYGSPQTLAVIVTNLVRNALQHARCHRVEVSIDAQGVNIEDDGIGLPDQDVARAQARGRGLTIVRRLCEREGWVLHFERPATGGTRVRVAFSRPEEEDSGRE